ncbi:hypothetical protein K501DRAFT_266292 [Backusella circina FSU 941]|nr:hypothetical protein K501DRAFT_266292 [Backusella circina FSU 941]
MTTKLILCIYMPEVSTVTGSAASPVTAAASSSSSTSSATTFSVTFTLVFASFLVSSGNIDTTALTRGHPTYHRSLFAASDTNVLPRMNAAWRSWSKKRVVALFTQKFVKPLKEIVMFWFSTTVVDYSGEMGFCIRDGTYMDRPRISCNLSVLSRGYLHTPVGPLAVGTDTTYDKTD